MLIWCMLSLNNIYSSAPARVFVCVCTVYTCGGHSFQSTAVCFTRIQEYCDNDSCKIPVDRDFLAVGCIPLSKVVSRLSTNPRTNIYKHSFIKYIHIYSYRHIIICNTLWSHKKFQSNDNNYILCVELQ